MNATLFFAFRAYRVIIYPWLTFFAGTSALCRFYPSCSHYAESAIARHGPVRGIMRATLRLLRCHPWHPGGYDPPT